MASHWSAGVVNSNRMLSLVGLSTVTNRVM